jgi:hypothetical protein
MYTPRSRLRMTAYHMVDASPIPGSRSHGAAAPRPPVSTPASQELALGGDLTRVRIDEEQSHSGRG